MRNSTKQTPSKPRGRPPSYSPEVALQRAADVFWNAGFSGSSLDDLGAAMEMNRPSLYGAFGNKEELYLTVLGRYIDAGHEAMQNALADDVTLREGLERMFHTAMALYLGGDQGPRGCLLLSTAATEAVLTPTVRSALAAGLHKFDQVLQARFALAKQRKEVPTTADPQALAILSAATLHSIAIRARAGHPRAALAAAVQALLDIVCPQKSPRGQRKSKS